MKLDLEPIKAREAAATNHCWHDSSPWKGAPQGCCKCEVTFDTSLAAEACEAGEYLESQRDVPALIAEVERLCEVAKTWACKQCGYGEPVLSRPYSNEFCSKKCSIAAAASNERKEE